MCVTHTFFHRPPIWESSPFSLRPNPSLTRSVKAVIVGETRNNQETKCLYQWCIKPGQNALLYRPQKPPPPTA